LERRGGEGKAYGVVNKATKLANKALGYIMSSFYVETIVEVFGVFLLICLIAVLIRHVLRCISYLFRFLFRVHNNKGYIQLYYFSSNWSSIRITLIILFCCRSFTRLGSCSDVKWWESFPFGRYFPELDVK